MNSKFTKRLTLISLIACVILGCLGNIGCQSTRNGQTLTSPHYLKNPPQFFAAGQEFPLSKEAAQMEKEQAEFLKARQQQ